MGVRFLHLADLHLGSCHDYLGDGADQRTREVMETFRGAIDFALDPERGIDGILIAGNLFDRHRPDPETLSSARDLLGRLVAARKPVVIVPGYRDGYSYKDSVYRTEAWPGIHIVTNPHSSAPLKLTIRNQDVFVYGVAAQLGLSSASFEGFDRHSPPHDHEDEEVDLRDHLSILDVAGPQGTTMPADTPALMAAHVVDPGIHVGVLCTALPDHPEHETRPHVQTVDPQVLADSGLDYVALGGYHGFATYELDGTLAAYPGTLEGRRFETGDLGQKSLLVVDIDEGKVEFTQSPTGACSLAEWTIDLGAERISDPKSLADAMLARASDRVIARIHLVGPLEFICDLEDIADKVRGGFRHLEIIDRTDLLGSGLLRRIQGEHTIRGFFVRRMVQLLSDLESRAGTADIDAPIHRELRVARTALKLGLEQFIDQETAPEVLYSPPAARKDEPQAVEETANRGTARAAGDQEKEASGEGGL